MKYLFEFGQGCAAHDGNDFSIKDGIDDTGRWPGLGNQSRDQYVVSTITRTRLSYLVDERGNFILLERPRLACGKPQTAHYFAEALSRHERLLRFDNDDRSSPLNIDVIAHFLEPCSGNQQSIFGVLCAAHIYV